MLTLTNFEDLLEKIKNITTPYEYYSIKEIYEKNKDQLTPEQQKIIEEEYKKKASMLNPKYYERKIKDGARIITIGIDLTNNGEISDINFEEFKKYICKGKEISKINKQHLLDLLPNEFTFETVDKCIQEYIIDKKKIEEKEEVDINLLYLFARKNHILTPKGREGFIHIRFFNKNLKFYEIENLKSPTYSFDYDKEKKEIAYIVKKNDINEIPVIKKQPFEANVKGYLHVDYNDDNNTISRVATVTFVIEHLIKNDKNFDYNYFLRNVEDFYIEWKNKNNSNGNEIEGDKENIYRNKYIRKLQVESEGKKEIKEFVTFEDFLLLNIWNEIVYPIRKNIYEKIKTINYFKKLIDYVYVFYNKLSEIIEKHYKEYNENEKHLFFEFILDIILENKRKIKESFYKIIKLYKESLNPDIFIENIKKQKEFIMFQNSSIVLDKAPELENYSWKKIPDYFIEDILDFFGLGGKFANKRNIFDKNYIERIKENGFEMSNEIAYENYNCAITPLDTFNMKDFYQNIINFEEGGLKRAMAWLILLGDMVTTSATYFILYNNEIEEHLSKKKSSSKELRKITQKAISDFEFYYDIDIVNARLFRETFESIKNTFKLNYYHKVLLDRLQLFSNFEIAEENKKITILLAILTGFLVGLTIAQIILEILPHFIKF
jgi:hypothetical protein